MQLTLMYHRAGTGKFANTPDVLDSHFKFLKEQGPILLPGDPLPKRKLSFCLTFDDATYDFYHSIFPLLKKWGIRAVLGVPTHYILDSTTCTSEERLAVPYTLSMQEGIFEKKAPFCTWKELQEMVDSGFVEVASHSHLHCNLRFKFVDLHRELVLSKEILEKRLSQPITTFIYPFGKVNHAVHEQVAKHYAYAFRIGSGLNWNWGNGKNPLFRVSADMTSDCSKLLSFSSLSKYFLKNLIS